MRRGGKKKKTGLLGLLSMLVLVFWNARGILNKDNTFKDLLSKEGAVYGGISESMTFQSISQLSDVRWRWDPGKEHRPTIDSLAPSRGMGVLVDRNRCRASPIFNGDFTMWHRIELSDPKHEGHALIVGTGYFPSAQDIRGHRDANKELLERLTLYRRQGHHVVFGGDLNAHLGLNADLTPTDTAGNLLLDTIHQAGMVLMNSMDGICFGGPSRVQVREDGIQQSTIDYVMCSPSLARHIDSLTISDDQLGSDHKPLIAKFKAIDTIPAPTTGLREVWNVSNIPSPPESWSWVIACQTRFKAWMEEAHEATRALDAVDADSNRIADILEWSFQRAMDEVAADQLGTKWVGLRSTPTIDKAMDLLMSQKKVAECLMKGVMSDPDSSDSDRSACRAQFLRLSRAVVSYRARQRELAELKLFRDIESHQNNSKLFWGKYKTIRGTAKAGKAPPPVVKDNCGNTITDPTDVLRAWRDFSAGIANSDLEGTKEEGIYDEDHRLEVERKLHLKQLARVHQHDLDYPITDLEVFAAIRKLVLGKAPGEDGILTDIIKTAADAVNNSKLRGNNSVVSAIALLFNFVLDREVWPERWGSGVIFPLFKSGSRLDPSNYRPITLLSAMGKLFGIIIDNRLTRFSEQIGMTSDEQGGFRPHRGTPDQVFLWREILASRRERKLPTYACFVDVRKAYDTVWREQAYVRIHDGGIKGKLWRQLQVMHSGLSRRVRHPLGTTEAFAVKRGVAQGAVESPWVYSAFIDGLAKALHEAGLGIMIAGRRVPLLMYADDMVFLANSAAELASMNKVATEFARKNRFQFNGSKSGVMVFNVSAKDRRRARERRWILFGDQVQVVDEYVYLGTVTVNAEGSWSKHLMCAVDKAKKRSEELLWLFRQDVGFRPRTAVTLWQAMVRPVLEYASEIWGGQVPEYAMNAAEGVQMSFLRGTLGLHSKGNGVPDEVVRAEAGVEPLRARWAKLQLGYWRRIFTAPRDRLLRVVASFRHRERMIGDRGIGSRGCMRAVQENLITHSLGEYWLRPTMLSAISASDWKTLVYDNVDKSFDEARAARLEGMSSARDYVMIKSWDVNVPEYCVMSGEEGRLGQNVPESYLDDRNNLKGTRLKLLCRTNCLPVMNRIGREVRPSWPKAHRLCLMCDRQAVEDVPHFVMDCPAYARHRARLFACIARALSHTPACIDFAKATRTEKLHIVLGKRSGCARIDRSIDRMVKAFLTKTWSTRQPVTSAINDVLSVNYGIMSRAR